MPTSSSEQPSQTRQIRVFISSTFRDMQAERDYLVKFVFPQLRKLCESRGVTWGEVDLRWGVTDEQAAEGRVLPICLEEIKRCRPYFIGLLGERYGWIPEALPADLLEREPWLKEHLHGKTSVTELEILHGVLRNPEMAGHAYFYFRDPAYVNSIPEKDRKDFTAENAKDTEKLRHLKENIRRNGFPVRENYPDPKVLGELVLADLTAVIDKLFPEGSQPDPLDREAMDHEAYAQSRERVYIGRQEYFDRLNTHAAANDTHPLVILGESGSGKSALLANWVARYRRAHPDVLVLQHYIGATPYSADWAAMLRRLMGEFKRRLGLQQDIPDQPDALRSAFPNWLYMAAAKGRVVLVLDALNQLEDRDGAPNLVWLPFVLPKNVRLIVSTLPGRPLDEIQKRRWPAFKVELLSGDERRKLITEYLSQHAKTLSAMRLERITAAPPSANPLCLRVLLDELRLVRTHEELEERIGDYLRAASPYALYGKVIARWEQDYGKDELGKPTKIVGDTLSLLWAARRGLTETELLQALGKDREPLPRAKWSPLFLAMSDALISRGGLLTFAHDFLRTAVLNAYLPTERNQQQAHLRLADCFEQQPTSPRRTDELPWQLSEAAAWYKLRDILVEKEFVVAACSSNEVDIKTFWARLEIASPIRRVDAYRKWIEHPEAESDKLFMAYLGGLLEDHPDEWNRIYSGLTVSAAGDPDSLPPRLLYKATVLMKHGDLDGALKLVKEQQQICSEIGNLHDLQWGLSIEAVIFGQRGELNRSMSLLKEQERICRQLGKVEGLVWSLKSQAQLLREKGELEGALAVIGEAERICRQSGDLDNEAGCLGTRATILSSRGDLEEAMTLHGEEELIYRQLGDLRGLLRSLGNRAIIFRDRGDLPAAIAVLKENELICRKLNVVDQLARSLMNQAMMMERMHQSRNALPLAEEAYQLASNHGHIALAQQFGPILADLRRAFASETAGEHARSLTPFSDCASPTPTREPTIPELRDLVATALKRGLWEAAATHLEKLLQQGEPVETVAPDLITALLNAHETIFPATVTRIETLLAQLEAAGHAALATQLRQQHASKLAPPKRPWWKVW